MDQLIRLDDVRALVRAHVRKVDQMRTYRFLQQASGVSRYRAQGQQAGGRWGG